MLRNVGTCKSWEILRRALGKSFEFWKNILRIFLGQIATFF